MKFRASMLLVCAALVASMALADGGGSSAGRKSGAGVSRVAGATSNAAENGLVLVKLYDTGLRVLQLYGDPDEILAVGGGGAAAVGPTGGGPGGAGFPGGPGGGRQGGGGGGGGAAPVSADQFRPGSFQGMPFMFQDQGEGDAPPQRGGPAGGPPFGGPPGGPGRPGVPGAPGGAGGGAPAAGNDSRVLYTRWVYRRGPARYAFIFDRFNRVVQIEAVGMNDSRVRTNRGIRFGSQFSDIVRRYGAPDAYELMGDTLVVRYLVRQKVAFRLNRLEPKGKHKVTGVVVAAGKQ